MSSPEVQRITLQLNYSEKAPDAIWPLLPGIFLQQFRCSALFGHDARLQQDVPALKALHCHVDLSLGRPPNDQWKRRPGRP